MSFINSGIPVTILELDKEALKKGLGVIQKNYDSSAKRGRFTEAQVTERMNLITGTTSYDDLADTDLVIEAVFENMEVKKEHPIGKSANFHLSIEIQQFNQINRICGTV